jgi:O-antigen ligase
MTAENISRKRRTPTLDVAGLAFAFLWLLIFCVPWEEEFAVAKGIALSHVVGAGASVAGVFAALVSSRVRKLHPVHYLLGALVLWIAVSYLWSYAPDATITKAGSSAQLLLMAWLIWEFASTESRQRSLLAGYVLGSYVSATSVLFAFMTHSGSNLGLVEGRYTATGFDENELGVTLALALVMSCYLLALNQRYQFVWLLHIPVSILAICLTGSRGAFLAIGVAAIIIPFSLAALDKRKRWIVLSALIIFLGVVLAVIPKASWQRIGTIHSEFAEGTLTNRTRIWAAGLEVYREHPIVGVGSGAFGESVYSRLDIPYVAHNSYLSILVELGAIGATLFASVLCALFYLTNTLPKLQRRVWLIMLLTWCVAISSLTWEHRKPTWFLFGLLISQSAALECRAGSPAFSRNRTRVGTMSEVTPF